MRADFVKVRGSNPVGESSTSAPRLETHVSFRDQIANAEWPSDEDGSRLTRKGHWDSQDFSNFA